MGIRLRCAGVRLLINAGSIVRVALARFPDLPIVHAAIMPPSTVRMLPVVHRDCCQAGPRPVHLSAQSV
jgi:hypothetical protein